MTPIVARQVNPPSPNTKGAIIQRESALKIQYGGTTSPRQFIGDQTSEEVSTCRTRIWI
jgi:hypothetical protein